MWTDPRFGRLQEGFSENPTISSRMGAAYALGLQGPPTGAESYLATAKVIALAKHYAACEYKSQQQGDLGFNANNQLNACWLAFVHNLAFSDFTVCLAAMLLTVPRSEDGAASGGLNAAPADISNRTLHDVYLRPWRAFTEAGGRGVGPASVFSIVPSV